MFSKLYTFLYTLTLPICKNYRLYTIFQAKKNSRSLNFFKKLRI
jgi:hypothetical protein